jgi:homoserine dehydrogenase
MIDSRTGLRRVALVVAGPTGTVGSALLRLLEEKEVTARGVFADVVHAALETHSHGHCC